MKKASILIIILLLLLLFAAILWQWGNYSAKSGDPSGTTAKKINQEITVNVEQDGLKVRQVFKGIKDEKGYSVLVPKQAENFSCKDLRGAFCEEGTRPQFFKAEGDQLQFEYLIKAKRKADRILFVDWLVLLAEPEGSKTRIEIVDKSQKGGTWIAGLPLKGYKKAEMVDYYVFEGNGRTPSLYWQKEELEHFPIQDGISYYSAIKERPQVIGTFDNLIKFGETDHLSVVFNDGHRPVTGNGLLLTSSRLPKWELEQEMAKAFIAMKFKSLEPKEVWLLETLASLITDRPAINSKSQSIIKELSGKLSEAEKKEFLSILYSNKKNLDHERLDAQLASITGMETHFFTLNRLEESSLHPLIFLDGRKISINGKTIKGLHISIEGEKRLYPLVGTMNSLGYQVVLDETRKSLKVTNESSTYSFDLKNNAFVVNNNYFGLLENPFKTINGSIYVEQHWLTAIFDISIKENDNEIILSL